MSPNLIGIAGVPARQGELPLGGKLLGVSGCGCGVGTGMGETDPTAEQSRAFGWAAVGLAGAALLIGYFVLREHEA